MMKKAKNGQFLPLSLNEKIRRAYVKNPNSVSTIAKSLGVSYQRCYNPIKKMKLAIVPAGFWN